MGRGARLPAPIGGGHAAAWGRIGSTETQQPSLETTNGYREGPRAAEAAVSRVLAQSTHRKSPAQCLRSGVKRTRRSYESTNELFQGRKLRGCGVHVSVWDGGSRCGVDAVTLVSKWGRPKEPPLNDFTRRGLIAGASV